MRFASLIPRAVFSVANAVIVALYVHGVWSALPAFSSESSFFIAFPAGCIAFVMLAIIYPSLLCRRGPGRILVLYLGFLIGSVLLGLWVGDINGYGNTYIQAQRKHWPIFLRDLVCGVPITVIGAHFTGLPLLLILCVVNKLTGRWLLPAASRAEA
ncbi:MAG: hypothetical protein WCF18_15680 [Chthoniobacteraceae bacterium]